MGRRIYVQAFILALKSEAFGPLVLVVFELRTRGGIEFSEIFEPTRRGWAVGSELGVMMD